MAGIYEFEGWAARIIRAYHEPPINAFRVLALGLDGSNAVAIKVASDGTVATSGGSGGDGAILDGAVSSIKATVKDYANSNPLAVQLMDNNGDPASVGGGTQYTEGDTDASITGTAAMWEDTSDTLRAISMAKPLPVQPGTGAVFSVLGTVTSTIAAMPEITGTVTANAGLGTFQVAGIVTANAGLGTWSVVGTVTSTIAALPAITGNVTVQGEVSTEALFATHVSTGINLTHTTTWTVAISTPSTMWRHVEFINTTDTDIQLSYDGGTTKHRTYPAGYAGAVDFKANDLHVTSWLTIRNDGAAPTRGKVYVHASGT